MYQCVYGGTSDTSTVRVDNPAVQIVSQDDLALNAKVSDINSVLNNTIVGMGALQGQIAVSNARLASIVGNLSQLGFNVTQLVPYEDFTALRQQVDNMINSLQPSGKPDCSGGVFQFRRLFWRKYS